MRGSFLGRLICRLGSAFGIRDHAHTHGAALPCPWLRPRTPSPVADRASQVARQAPLSSERPLIVLIRPEVGPGVGLDHLDRCLALAQGLERFGAAPVFAVHPDEVARARTAARGFASVPIEGDPGSHDELPGLLQAAASASASAVVTDSYRIDGGYLAALRAQGLIVASVDDQARFGTAAHLVVDGSIHAEKAPHRSTTGDTEFLLGTDYALLQREYWHPAPRRIRPRAARVLVAVDLAHHPVAEGVLSVLAGVQPSLTIAVVLGPYEADTDWPSAWARRFGDQLTVLRGPLSLREHLLEADLVVCGGGQTAYQALAVGTPVLALGLAHERAGDVEALGSAGLAQTVAVSGGMADEGRLRGALLDMLQATGFRKKLADRGQRAVDGQGAIRVARRLAYRARGKV